MPANECIPWYEVADRLTGQATAAVTGKRFVVPSATRASGPLIPATAQVGASDPTDGGNIKVAHAAAGGAALGVSSWDAAIGEKVTVICEGVVPVTADGAIAAGDPIVVGATGKAKTRAATGAVDNLDDLPVTVGIAVDAAVDGADAQIKLSL